VRRSRWRASSSERFRPTRCACASSQGAYDFDQINHAAEDALAGEVVKPVLLVG
jgi:hypothetical protein